MSVSFAVPDKCHMLRYEQNNCLSPRNKRVEVEWKWQVYVFHELVFGLLLLWTSQPSAGEKGVNDWSDLPR